MAFGKYDLVAIADMPDDEAMAGVSLAVSATRTAALSGLRPPKPRRLFVGD